MSATALPTHALRSIRIAVRPDPADCPNPYLRLFYQALEPCGVTVAEPLKVNDDWLREHAAMPSMQSTFTGPRRSGGRRRRAGTLKRIVGLLSFLRLAGRLGIKRVWTVHNIVPHEARAGVDFLGSLALARSADLLICHSEETADAGAATLSAARVDRRDAARQLRRRLSRSRGRVRWSFATSGWTRIGRSWPVSANSARTKASMSPAQPSNVSAAPFNWIVAGQPHAEMPPILADLRSTDAVVLNRRVSDQEFADITSAADLVWLPYHHVTGSSVILASLTLGTAVVASDLPFFREVLEHEGPAGLLAPAGDAQRRCRMPR